MSLNLYRYHSDPESLRGDVGQLLDGIMKEQPNYNKQFGELVYMQTGELREVVDLTGNELARQAASSLAGEDSFIDWFYHDYSPSKEEVEFEFDKYFETYPEDDKKLKSYLKKEYDYDGEQDIFDFVYDNNIDEIVSALDSAYFEGIAVGAENDMHKHFKSALEDIPYLRYDGDNILHADQYYITYSLREFDLEFDVHEDIDDFLDAIHDDISEAIIWNFSFREPHDGWIGFHEESAFDRLRDELYGEIFSKDDE
jgi:hypothetical protein